MEIAVIRVLRNEIFAIFVEVSIWACFIFLQGNLLNNGSNLTMADL